MTVLTLDCSVTSIHLVLFFISQVLEAFAKAEKIRKPNPELMFTDVYEEVPTHLKEQLSHMKQHVNTYKEHYPLDSYQKMSS